ncbi:MAG: cation diffusion facilitator family transporter [Cyclobacteriaceae bacterium]|nr:cation diffusion facilitator family transporter [Cyclobacteriaceae bacterium]
MSHSHHHDNATKNIKTAFFLNLLFTIIEVFGGLYTNSIAILSDAVHDLGDTISLGLSWYFQHLSRKKRDNTYSYGYKRFSLLGAIITSIILLVGSLFILSETIPRLINPEQANAEGMMLLAILGVIVNGAAVLRLRNGSSINEKVVSLHLWEDVLGWLAVLVGSIVMHFWDLPIIDPLLSAGIAVYILVNIYKNLKQSFQIILQGIPKHIDIGKVEKLITNMEEVHSVHDCHVWTMDGEYNVFTAHVVLYSNYDIDSLEKVKASIKLNLQNKDIHHITIEFENAENELCPQDV